MDTLQKLLFTILLFLTAAAIKETRADAMITGTVFCDQCKDGERSLFDYPLYGVKVVMACGGSNGQVTMWKEETTNWFGNFAMRLDGTPDLTGCYAQVTGSGDDSTGCGAVAGPARELRPMFKMFDMEIYTVDSLLSQPAQPMPYCPRSASPPSPVLPLPAAPPPTPPAVRLPPLPPMPFLEASACSSQTWVMPEFKCYWKIVNPDTKVAVAFGLIAARKYGTDMSLREGLQGRGDLYRTLLREATTSLLNSYNSMQFAYPTLAVIEHFNLALMGSQRSALLMALRFKRANSGYGKVRCNFTPCK